MREVADQFLVGGSQIEQTLFALAADLLLVGQQLQQHRAGRKIECAHHGMRVQRLVARAVERHVAPLGVELAAGHGGDHFAQLRRIRKQLVQRHFHQLATGHGQCGFSGGIGVEDRQRRMADEEDGIGHRVEPGERRRCTM